MANGKHDIQMLMADGSWRTDLRMQMMGRDFARGAFFALKGLSGGGLTYRLIRREGSKVVEIDQHKTGHIRAD